MIVSFVGKRLVGHTNVVEPVSVLIRFGERGRGFVGLKCALPESCLGVLVTFLKGTIFAGEEDFD